MSLSHAWQPKGEEALKGKVGIWGWAKSSYGRQPSRRIDYGKEERLPWAQMSKQPQADMRAEAYNKHQKKGGGENSKYQRWESPSSKILSPETPGYRISGSLDVFHIASASLVV